MEGISLCSWWDVMARTVMPADVDAQALALSVPSSQSRLLPLALPASCNLVNGTPPWAAGSAAQQCWRLTACVRRSSCRSQFSSATHITTSTFNYWAITFRCSVFRKELEKAAALPQQASGCTRGMFFYFFVWLIWKGHWIQFALYEIYKFWTCGKFYVGKSLI